ncbi:hypothetical protein ACOMHN_024849 [Nucella lapillus]
MEQKRMEWEGGLLELDRNTKTSEERGGTRYAADPLCRRPIMPPTRYATDPLCRRPVMPLTRCTANPLCRRPVMPPTRCAADPLCCYPALFPFWGLFFAFHHMRA